MSRMRSARSFASAVRTRLMPEALSNTEMVMTSDRRYCRYVKVNRFLDQPRGAPIEPEQVGLTTRPIPRGPNPTLPTPSAWGSTYRHHRDGILRRRHLFGLLARVWRARLSGTPRSQVSDQSRSLPLEIFLLDFTNGVIDQPVENPSVGRGDGKRRATSSAVGDPFEVTAD